MKGLVIGIVLLAALVAGYFAIVTNWSYSTGERAGWVQKFSNKGWICKTWEGELALVSLPGSAVEKFNFTVRDDAVADKINKIVGRRVSGAVRASTISHPGNSGSSRRSDLATAVWPGASSTTMTFRFVPAVNIAVSTPRGTDS